MGLSLWLLCAKGRFWWRHVLPKYEVSPGVNAIAVVPARDEAAVIGTAVASIGTRVIVVDDHSSDATAAIARHAGAEIVSHFRSRRPS